MSIKRGPHPPPTPTPPSSPYPFATPMRAASCLFLSPASTWSEDNKVLPSLLWLANGEESPSLEWNKNWEDLGQTTPEAPKQKGSY